VAWRAVQPDRIPAADAVCQLGKTAHASPAKLAIAGRLNRPLSPQSNGWSRWRRARLCVQSITAFGELPRGVLRQPAHERPRVGPSARPECCNPRKRQEIKYTRTDKKTKSDSANAVQKAEDGKTSAL
jgi:hypothetical protein